MTQKNRLILVLIGVVLFLITVPTIIFYSLGYRFDLEAKKIVATGGIYIKASPLGTDVIINSNTDKKTGIFSTYVFVQNLLPKQHTILIKKDGYFDYQKTLSVKEKEVTKLENVTLFKKDIPFEELKNLAQSPFTENPKEEYALKSNNLYSIKNNEIVLKNIITFFKNPDRLIWLASDGFLYQSDNLKNQPEKISQQALVVNKKNLYKLFIFNENIFLKQNSEVMLLDKTTKTFSPFAQNIIDLKLAEDNQKIAYWNENQISIYYLQDSSKESYLHDKNVLLKTFPEKIKQVFWVNNDYLLIQLTSGIFISEIDARNNVNTILLSLPEFTKITPTTKIIFNQQDKKIYIQNDKKTFVSEKLVP